MDTIWMTATVLAALELTPGEPADLTAILRADRDRQALFGQDVEHPISADWNSTISPLAHYLSTALDHGRTERWAKVLDHAARERTYVPVVAGTPEYPRRLNLIWDAPPVLFRSLAPDNSMRSGAPASAELDPAGRALAIVGGREATAEVLTTTRTVAAHLAGEGVRIVSGLAAGVDTAAHVGALRGGGLTTAVLGTGIDHVFPSENRALANQIRHQGVVVSQFAPPAPRTRTTFLRRNAVIAALSDASLIMDGRDRSGTRHEAEQAVRYGKPVLLWAAALAGEEWANSFVNAGIATFVESVEDVTAVLG